MTTTKNETFIFVVGLILILLPLFFVVLFPDKYQLAEIYLRIIASIGGALVGVWIPGALNIEIPGIKAGGALAVLVIFWQFNPPGVVDRAIASEPKEIPVMTIEEYFIREGS